MLVFIENKKGELKSRKCSKAIADYIYKLENENANLQKRNIELETYLNIYNLIDEIGYKKRIDNVLNYIDTSFKNMTQISFKKIERILKGGE